jgi:pimeloyl-ACP methyl ester carboxylesterase
MSTPGTGTRGPYRQGMRSGVTCLRALLVVAALLLLGCSAAPAQPGATPAAAFDAATRDDDTFNRTFRHEFAQVDDVRMHYVIGGQGPPLVLLHGWPSTWYEWIEVMPALAERHTVIAVDLPGLGDSQGAPPSYDKATLARYLHRLVGEQLGHRSINLVGHDFGVGVAYQYAAQHRAEVRRLAVMDFPLAGASGGTESTLWWFGFHTAPGQLAEQLVDDEVGTYLAGFYPQVGASPEPVSAQAVAEYTRTYSQPQQLTGGFELYRTVPQDTQDNLDSFGTPLEMPVLALAPQRGPAALDAVLASLRVFANDVAVVEVASPGHWLPEEQPEAVAAELLEFVAIS